MANAQEDMGPCIPAEEIEEIQKAVEGESLNSAAGKITEYFELLDTTELNIAVTGETGRGKSTFINAIRGLGNDDDDESAPTGVVETTMEPTPYPYAKFPNVKLWDLPGIGTENFKADQYLELVKFDRYDFFIIISERFTSNDANLARVIQEMGKRFYLVRSKIDQSLLGEKRKKTYNEKKILDQIRKDCITGLQKLNMTSPKVFLISSFYLEKYDFLLLQEAIEQELSEIKKCIFLLALPNTSEAVILRKKAVLQANIWKIALLSAAVAAVPIPALGISVDLSLLMREIDRFTKAFGLDESSLRSLAEHVGVPVEELKKHTKFRLDLMTKDMVLNWLDIAASGAIGLSTRLIAIRSIMAAGTSFVTTYCMLNDCLNKLAADAHHVMVMACLRMASEQTEV